MRIPSLVTTCLLVILLSSGCASIIGGAGKQTLTLNTEPSGAVVYLNGNEKGSTPYTYSYSPDDGKEVVFELRQPGYKSATVSVRPERNNAVLFADAMLFHIPYMVDKNDPRMYAMPIGDITVNLYKESREHATRHMLPITAVTTDLATRADLGKLQGKPVKLDKESPFRDLAQPEILTSAIASGLRDSWLDARVVRMGTTKGDEALQKAKMYLRPNVKSLKADLSGERLKCYGPVVLEMDWKVMSALGKDSVLVTIPQRTTYYANGDRPSDVVNAAITHAARLFAEEEGLQERLGGHYGTSIALSKGGEVVLSAPAPIAFNSRREMIPALVKAVVTIQTEKGHGSGFIVSKDGYLITNEHVVGNESIVRVKFEQGFTLDAQVVKVNKDFDLALVKVQATDLPALTIGDDSALMLGEEIFAIGTPLDATLGQSVSRGVLSGRRELDGRNYLQTDVSINPGNSGGPFIDEDGKVVGVATMKISGKGLEGLGFGVPISVALEMLNIRMTR